MLWAGFPSLEEFSTVCCDLCKGFGIINKAEIDVFLELSCFLIKRSNSDLGTHIDSMKGAGKK